MITQSKRDRLLRRKARETAKIFKQNVCDFNNDYYVVCFNRSGRHIYLALKHRSDPSSILHACSTLSFREKKPLKDEVAKSNKKDSFVYKNYSNKDYAKKLGEAFGKMLHDQKVLDKIQIIPSERADAKKKYSIKNLIFHLGGYPFVGVVSECVDSFRKTVLQLRGFE